jgi:hypothetical protein
VASQARDHLANQARDHLANQARDLKAVASQEKEEGTTTARSMDTIMP